MHATNDTKETQKRKAQVHFYNILIRCSSTVDHHVTRSAEMETQCTVVGETEGGEWRYQNIH